MFRGRARGRRRELRHIFAHEAAPAQVAGQRGFVVALCLTTTFFFAEVCDGLVVRRFDVVARLVVRVRGDEVALAELRVV
jgi:hypothetical protein